MKRARKLNAETHGIFSRILLAGDAFGESREQLLALISELRESIAPTTSFESILIEKLAVLFFRLTRVYEADSKIAPKLFARVSALLGPGQPGVKAKWVSPQDQVVVVQRDPTSDSLMRYETSLERQICRTIGQLESFRRLRRANLTPAFPKAESEEPNDETAP